MLTKPQYHLHGHARHHDPIYSPGLVAPAQLYYTAEVEESPSVKPPSDSISSSSVLVTLLSTAQSERMHYTHVMQLALHLIQQTL